MTESGKVEVVDIKFGNKTYENVSVKHLKPTDEGSHSHKRTSKELGVRKRKRKTRVDRINIRRVSGVITQKDLVKNFISKRKVKM